MWSTGKRISFYVIAEVRAIYDDSSGEALVEPDQQIFDAIKEDHEATLDYIRSTV